MAALVLDIGSWYRADRATQSAADAAALAGRRSSRRTPGNANTLALQYVDQERRRHADRDPVDQERDQRHDQGQLDPAAKGIFTRLFGVSHGHGGLPRERALRA
jgi:hypothetical protein